MVARLLNCTRCMATVAYQNWYRSRVMWVCAVISRSQRHLITHRLNIQPSRGILIVIKNRLRLRRLQPRRRVRSCRLLPLILPHKLPHPRRRILIGILSCADLSQVEFSMRSARLVRPSLRQPLHILTTHQIPPRAISSIISCTKVLLRNRTYLASDIACIEVSFRVALRCKSGAGCAAGHHSPTRTTYLGELLWFEGLNAVSAEFAVVGQVLRGSSDADDFAHKGILMQTAHATSFGVVKLRQRVELVVVILLVLLNWLRLVLTAVLMIEIIACLRRWFMQKVVITWRSIEW